MRMRIILILLPGLLAACGGGRASQGGLRVVAGESTYGDLARELGGPHVRVTSVLSSPNADPHLFEPRIANDLAVAQADVVIENGLGYDAFMDKLQSASPKSRRIEVVAADVLGLSGADTNPHLWYDLPALPRIGAAITRAFVRADPSHTRDYRRRLSRFVASLAPLRRTVSAIRASHAGAPVAVTEPVPGYLVAAAGLRDLAPTAFTRAIEDGSEPPPGAVAAMLELLRGRKVRVLLYNSQAVSPITARVRAAARAAGIPVVGVTETLPAGETFQRWQLGEAKALQAALG